MRVSDPGSSDGDWWPAILSVVILAAVGVVSYYAPDWFFDVLGVVFVILIIAIILELMRYLGTGSHV